MKTDHNRKYLSHIVIYVGKKCPESSISAFCTNMKTEKPDIRFTYLCYDNQTKDMMHPVYQLKDPVTEEYDNMFVISDSPEVISKATDSGIAAAALYTSDNRDCDFSKALYCIEDIEFISCLRIVRMWERFWYIPWTIAVTDRLVIREQVIEDIETLYSIYSDKEISKYTEALYEDPLEERDYLKQYIDSQYRFFEYGIWALTLKSDGTLIGRAGISNREGYDIPEIGYVIGKQYRRCGYAGEAVRAILEYGRNELGFEEFAAFTKEKNVASVRLLKSLGFSLAGFADIRGGEHAMYVLTKQ